MIKSIDSRNYRRACVKKKSVDEDRREMTFDRARLSKELNYRTKFGKIGDVAGETIECM